MLLKRTDRIEPGEIVGEKIVHNGVVLVTRGKKITEYEIKRLIDNDISEVYISDNELDFLLNTEDDPNMLDPTTVDVAIKSIKSADCNSMIESAKMIVEKLSGSWIPNYRVKDNRTADDYFFKRNVAVAQYALSIAKLAGLPINLHNDLAVVALAYDIGKTCEDPKKLAMAKSGITLAQEVKLKETKCNHLSVEDINLLVKNQEEYKVDFNKFRRMPDLEGREYLADKLLQIKLDNYDPSYSPVYSLGLFNNHPSAMVKTAIIHQNDNVKGTNAFLKSEKGSMGNIMAMIVKIAAAYDRALEQTKSPSEALEGLFGGNNSEYDADIVRIFYENIPPYTRGDIVELSDGREAIVEKNNAQLPLRPCVVSNKNAQMEDVVTSINLALPEHNDLTILELKETKRSIAK